MLTHLTPYSDVNNILHVLLSDVQKTLGNQFTGLYLYGSLAAGDFSPETSDIDFVVVTAAEITNEMFLALVKMHGRIAAGDSKWAIELEGSYMPQADLCRYDPAHAWRPCLERGRGERLRLEPDDSGGVIQRHILRQQGIVVAGPSPGSLIDPISPNEPRQAVLDILHKWWAPMLADSTKLRHSGYRTYAIFTMCRMLYTLQYGTIVSKPAAARWARDTLGERWAGLMEQALAWLHGGQSDNLSEALDFIRYTLEHSQQFEIPV